MAFTLEQMLRHFDFRYAMTYPNDVGFLFAAVGMYREPADIELFVKEIWLPNVRTLANEEENLLTTPGKIADLFCDLLYLVMQHSSVNFQMWKLIGICVIFDMPVPSLAPSSATE